MADSAPKKNRRSKVEVVTIDDDVTEVPPSPSKAELQEQLRVAERDKQRLIVICGEKQTRIEFLEGLVDKKPEVLQTKTTETKELEKKVEELEKGRKEDLERIIDLSFKLARSENKIDDLCQEVTEILKNNPDQHKMSHASGIISRLLTSGDNYLIDEMSNSGFLSFLVQGMTIDDVRIQNLCAWSISALTFIPDPIAKILHGGAIVRLIGLMTHANFELATNATFAVATIARSSAQLRDLIIQWNGVETLTTLCGKMKELPNQFVIALSKAYFSMCMNMNSPASLSVIKVLLQGSIQLLQIDCQQVRYNALSAVTLVASGSHEQKTLILDSGILPLVCKCLNEDEDGVVKAALGVLINMTAGSDPIKQAVVDVGALGVLLAVAQKAKDRSVVRECCMLVSNVIAGTDNQSRAVIINGLLAMLVNAMQTGDADCEQLCSLALYNFTVKATMTQIQWLLAEKPMTGLAAALSHTDLHCASNVLYVIYKLIFAASPNQLGTVKEEMKTAGILDQLKKLQGNTDERVRNLACKIHFEFFVDIDKEQTEQRKEEEEPEKKKVKSESGECRM